MMVVVAVVVVAARWIDRSPSMRCRPSPSRPSRRPQQRSPARASWAWACTRSAAVSSTRSPRRHAALLRLRLLPPLPLPLPLVLVETYGTTTTTMTTAADALGNEHHTTTTRSPWPSSVDRASSSGVTDSPTVSMNASTRPSAPAPSAPSPTIRSVAVPSAPCASNSRGHKHPHPHTYTYTHTTYHITPPNSLHSKKRYVVISSSQMYLHAKPSFHSTKESLYRLLKELSHLT